MRLGVFFLKKKVFVAGKHLQRAETVHADEIRGCGGADEQEGGYPRRRPRHARETADSARPLDADGQPEDADQRGQPRYPGEGDEEGPVRAHGQRRGQGEERRCGGGRRRRRRRRREKAKQEAEEPGPAVPEVPRPLP